MSTNFKIKGEFIELIKLLKATQIAESGAQAQIMVVDKQVKVNGQLETRKRAKLKAGDKVETPFGNIILE